MFNKSDKDKDGLLNEKEFTGFWNAFNKHWAKYGNVPDPSKDKPIIVYSVYDQISPGVSGVSMKDIQAAMAIGEKTALANASKPRSR